MAAERPGELKLSSLGNRPEGIAKDLVEKPVLRWLPGSVFEPIHSYRAPTVGPHFFHIQEQQVTHSLAIAPKSKSGCIGRITTRAEEQR